MKTLFWGFLIFLIKMERLKELELSELLMETQAPYDDTELLYDLMSS